MDSNPCTSQRSCSASTCRRKLGSSAWRARAAASRDRNSASSSDSEIAARAAWAAKRSVSCSSLCLCEQKPKRSPETSWAVARVHLCSLQAAGCHAGAPACWRVMRSAFEHVLVQKSWKSVGTPAVSMRHAFTVHPSRRHVGDMLRNSSRRHIWDAPRKASSAGWPCLRCATSSPSASLAAIASRIRHALRMSDMSGRTSFGQDCGAASNAVVGADASTTRCVTCEEA